MVKARVEEVLSKILSRKHKAKIRIKFKERKECQREEQTK